MPPIRQIDQLDLLNFRGLRPLWKAWRLRWPLLPAAARRVCAQAAPQVEEVPMKLLQPRCGRYASIGADDLLDRAQRVARCDLVASSALHCLMFE